MPVPARRGLSPLPIRPETGRDPTGQLLPESTGMAYLKWAVHGVHGMPAASRTPAYGMFCGVTGADIRPRARVGFDGGGAHYGHARAVRGGAVPGLPRAGGRRGACGDGGSDRSPTAGRD